MRAPETIGQIVKHSGQPYRLVAIEPYERKSGGLSNLYRFETSCPDCGKPFQITAAKETKYPTRRCPEHRKMGVKAAVK